MASESWYKLQGENLILQLKVKSRASKNEVQGICNNRLKVRIKAPPIDGKANKCLLEFLAKEFAVAKSRLNISNGEHNKNKIVVIDKIKTKPSWFLDLVH